nr:HAMP domain-containing histidine kinase [Bdellovibrionales bacterium]
VLVDDLLDVTRIESGQIHYRIEELDISQVVEEVVERYADHLKAEGISLTCSTFGHAIVKGDRYRLEQVIVNILTNAAKYGEKKPIEVKVEDEDPNIRIDVIDDGIGIPSDKLEKVFERYERAVSPKNISGLGLGLYISREIISAHQGIIKVKSNEKSGTTFSIILPKAFKH